MEPLNKSLSLVSGSLITPQQMELRKNPKKLLAELRKVILLNPEMYNQSSFGNPDLFPINLAYEGEVCDKDYTNCGTPMCFAGWISHLTGDYRYGEQSDSLYSYLTRMASYIGVDRDKAIGTLFESTIKWDHQANYQGDYPFFNVERFDEASRRVQTAMALDYLDEFVSKFPAKELDEH
jgi:hypothetical protein